MQKEHFLGEGLSTAGTRSQMGHNIPLGINYYLWVELAVQKKKMKTSIAVCVIKHRKQVWDQSSKWDIIAQNEI